MKKTLHRFKLSIELKLYHDMIEVYEEGTFFTSAYSGNPIIKILEADKPTVSEDLIVYLFTLNQSLDVDSIREDMMQCLKEHLQSKSKELNAEVHQLKTLEDKINEELLEGQKVNEE
jgi:hypothetical protein